ncbi:MAG: hypothetical protein WC453_04395 [Patescibacteria group bacterium]
MLELNKKNPERYLAIFPVLLFLFFSLLGASALSAAATQVKTADSPTVYFLSHRYSVKKPYINETSYLSYGNKWSDIKTVSQAELSQWPVARLFRAAGGQDIYYISGARKVLIKSPADLISFNLAGDPVLEVGVTDLAQYQTAGYADVGWEEPAADTPRLTVLSDPVPVTNDNSLVTNTNRNLLGIFRFRAPDQIATLTAFTLDLSGIYTRSIVGNIVAFDENNHDYDANINWRQTDHQIIVQMRPPLEFKPNEEKIIRILADLAACPTCTNQMMRLELTSASGVTASLPATADAWPIQGTQFKLVANDKILAQLKFQALPLDTDGTVAGGSRLISRLAVSEASGSEDAIIKEIVFLNNGSAGKDDWENFRLLKDGQVVARAAEVDNNGWINFPINYLRINKSGASELTVEADLTNDYKPQATYSLQVLRVTAAGNTYNLTLNPEIGNISEVHTLD